MVWDHVIEGSNPSIRKLADMVFNGSIKVFQTFGVGSNPSICSYGEISVKG